MCCKCMYSEFRSLSEAINYQSPYLHQDFPLNPLPVTIPYIQLTPIIPLYREP